MTYDEHLQQRIAALEGPNQSIRELIFTLQRQVEALTIERDRLKDQRRHEYYNAALAGVLLRVDPQNPPSARAIVEAAEEIAELSLSRGKTNVPL